MAYFVPVDELVAGAILGAELVTLPGDSAPTRIVVPAQAARVDVYARGTTVHVDCFEDQHGAGSPAPQPLTTDQDGRVVDQFGHRVYTSQPVELDVAVSGAGIVPYTMPVGNSGGAGAGTVTQVNGRTPDGQGHVTLVGSDVGAGGPLAGMAVDNAGNLGDFLSRSAGGASWKKPLLSDFLSVISETPEAHGAKGDGQVLTDATVDAGALNVLRSPRAPFSVADVGKVVMITLAGIYGAGGVHITTLSGFVDASRMTMATPAARAVSNQLAVYGTDDTAACRSATSTVVARAQAANAYYGEVQFSAKIYMLAGAPDHSQNGYAQIPLPYQQPTGMKFTLVFTGTADNSGLTHWSQPEPQMTGAVLVSAAFPAYSATYGVPSVIGGPTSEQGYGNGNNGTFSNMLVRTNGLTVVLPFDHPHNGVDCYGLAEANIGNLATFAFGTVVGGYWWPNFTPTSFLYGGNYVPCGLVMPNAGNNDNCNIGLYSSEGLIGGLALGEHTHADSIRVLNSWWGLTFTVLSNGGNPFANNDHSMDIDYLSTEMCRTHIWVPAATSPQVLNISNWDPEDTGNSVAHIADGDPGHLRGDINVNLQMVQQAPILHGGARVIDTSKATGNPSNSGLANPAVPASGASFKNPFVRDAAVTIGGGGLTGVAIDGQASPLVPGTYVVPSGKSITLTYTGSVSWAWTLL